jgi:hypothetical protein
MKYIIYGLIILLAIVHQDFWWWDSDSLMFGFLPIGLAFHAGISVSAALLWLGAVKYCWPRNVDVSDDLSSEATGEVSA